MADDWLDLLQSAVNFLASDFLVRPDDFAPYINFDSNSNICEWIGPGDGSDQQLEQLFKNWLNEMDIRPQMNQQAEVRIDQNNAISVDSRLNSNFISPSTPSSPCSHNCVFSKATPEGNLESNTAVSNIMNEVTESSVQKTRSE